MKKIATVRASLRRGLLAGLLGWAAFRGSAQPFVRQFYSDFDEGLPAGAEVRGDAYVDISGEVAKSGILRLTDAGQGRLGSLIVRDFAGGAEVAKFWARFQVRVGGGTGAEGFSFNVAPDLPPEAFGEAGAGGWLRVSFDTFQNQGEEAPAIALELGGRPLSRRAFPLRTDEVFAPVEILVTRLGGPPPVASASTRFQVSYRETNVIDHIVDGWFTYPAGTRWGLGARTGDVTDNHWIDDLLIVANYDDGPARVVVPPSITCVQYGERVKLSVVADGTPPLRYQWLRNGEEIPGARGPAYTTPQMVFPWYDSEYSVRVTNSQGTDTSPAVRVPPGCAVFGWQMAAGSNLVATPIQVPGDAISNLWVTAPDGATFRKFDNAAQAYLPEEVFMAGQGWLPGTTRLRPGEGGWFVSPTNVTLLATGTVVNPAPPAGLSGPGTLLRGSPVPAPAGYGEIFSSRPSNGLQVQRWHAPSQSWTNWTYAGGRWQPGAWEAAAGEGVIFHIPPPRFRPTISAIGNQRIFRNETNGPLAFTVSDRDTAASNLVVTVSSPNAQLLSAANSFIVQDLDGTNRTLTIVPTPGRFGRAQVTVTVRDVDDPPGFAESTSFGLRVRSLDGPPTFSAPPALSPSPPVPGDPLVLEADPDGEEPIVFVWRRNGALMRHILISTNTQLEISPNAQPQDGGTYGAVAINRLGVGNSSNTVVTVGDPVIPPGDFLTNATVIPDDAGQDVFSSAAASREEPAEPRHDDKPGRRSLWFKWQPGQDGIATFDTLGSTFDTLLAVYTGSTFGDLRKVVSDDDGSGYFNSRVRFNAETNRSYLVAVDGFHGEAGDVVLTRDLLTNVARLPMIRRHPEGLALPPRSLAAFSVEVDDPAPQELRYQWFHNGTNALAGQTSASLVRTQLSAIHLGTYRVEVIRDAVTNTSRDAVLELATAASVIHTFDKLGDAPTAAAPDRAPSLQRATRRPASLTVSVGTPGSRLFLNNSGDTQVQENFDRGIVFGRSRWIPVEMPDEGTLVVDTFGSGVDTVASLVRWDGSPDSDPVRLADDNDARTGVIWSLMVATNLPAGSNYYVLVDRVITSTNFNGTDGPIHVNWTFLNRDAEFRHTLPTLLTEADLRDVESLADKLVHEQGTLHDYLRGRLGDATNRLAAWLDRDPGLRTPAEVTGTLLDELNGLILGELLWTEERFANLVLETGLLNRVRAKFGIVETHPRLNRLLLEAVFNGELHRPNERLIRTWQSLNAPGEVHFRLVDDPARSGLRFESAGTLFDAAGGPGWREIAGSSDLAAGRWLNIIQLPRGGAAGENRFYRVVRQGQ